MSDIRMDEVLVTHCVLGRSALTYRITQLFAGLNARNVGPAEGAQSRMTIIHPSVERVVGKIHPIGSVAAVSHPIRLFPNIAITALCEQRSNKCQTKEPKHHYYSVVLKRIDSKRKIQ